MPIIKYKKMYSIKSILSAIILIHLIILYALPVSSAENKIQELMRDGDSREYHDIQIYCKKKFYYFIFDLIDDQNITPDIYQPLEHHIFAITHMNIEDVKRYIESENFLKNILKIYIEYKKKTVQLILSYKTKIITAKKSRSTGMLGNSVYDLNRKYSSLIDELNDKLSVEIKNDLLKSQTVTQYPRYTSQKTALFRKVFEEFKVVPYITRETKETSFREPDVMALLKENIEIYTELSKAFSNLKSVSNTMLGAENTLKNSVAPSKIMSEAYNLDKITHRWLASIGKIQIDCMNYQENLKELKKFLYKKITGFDSAAGSSGQGKETESDSEMSSGMRIIKEKEKISKREEKEESWKTREDIKKDEELKKRFESIYTEIIKIEMELEKIKNKNPNMSKINEAMIKFRVKIDQKEEEANEMSMERKSVKWRDLVKEWWFQYDVNPESLYRFNKYYDDRKNEWKNK